MAGLITVSPLGGPAIQRREGQPSKALDASVDRKAPALGSYVTAQSYYPILEFLVQGFSLSFPGHPAVVPKLPAAQLPVDYIQGAPS
jgi:hypothetical protein